MHSGLRFTRIDKAPLVPGLDIFLNGVKIGWLRDTSSMEVLVNEGDHLVQIGVPIWGYEADVITVPSGVTGVIQVGRQSDFFNFSYYIEVVDTLQRLPDQPLHPHSLENRNFIDLLLEKQATEGGLNSEEEDYIRRNIHLAHSCQDSNMGNSSHASQSTIRNKTVPTSAEIGAFVTLGLETNATEQQIKEAFRLLASIHHPDKGGNEKVFQRIAQAYSVALTFVRQ